MNADHERQRVNLRQSTNVECQTPFSESGEEVVKRPDAAGEKRCQALEAVEIDGSESS